MLLAEYSKHINNGGISIKISNDGGFVEVLMETSYFGYPSVSANLSGFLSSKNLKKIGLTFVKAANALKLQEEK